LNISDPRIRPTQKRVAHLLLVFVRNAASRTAPSREFGGRIGRLVDGSLPGLPRKVRKSPAMVVRAALSSSELPVWSRVRTIRRFPDQGGLTMVCEIVRKRKQTGSSEEQRAARTTIAGDLRTFRANPGRGPSTKAPRDPRTLAMVQCATRHFEQKPAEGGQPFAFLTQFFIYVQIGSDRWHDFHIFVQIDVIQIDI